MNKLVDGLLAPFLAYVLKLIEKDEYKKIYLAFTLFLLVMVFIIWVLSKLLANKKINSELKKNDEERKAKQIENFKKVEQARKDFISSLKNAQQILKMIISSFKNGDDTLQIAQNILQCRSIVFNDSMEKFETYIELYAIIYEGIPYRFVQLFTSEYISLMNQLKKILDVINNKKILKKTNLPFYFIDNYVFEKKFAYMKNHLPKYCFIKRYNNRKIRKDFVRNYSRKN